jgi:hypothetical protein
MKQAVLFQRIEAVFIFLASVYFYQLLHFSIWLFLLFLFSIDIFMLGYLKGNKIGAYAYNFGHSMLAPSALLVIGTIGSHRVLLASGLVWLAHIGWDRAFGYGLKYETGFTHTHLGEIGNKKAIHHPKKSK